MRILRKLRTIEGEPNVCVNSANPENLRRLICRMMSGDVSRTLRNCYSRVCITVGGSKDVAMGSGNENVPMRVRPGAKGSALRAILAMLRTKNGFNKKKCGMSNNLRKIKISMIGTLSR